MQDLQRTVRLTKTTDYHHDAHIMVFSYDIQSMVLVVGCEYGMVCTPNTCRPFFFDVDDYSAHCLLVVRMVVEGECGRVAFESGHINFDMRPNNSICLFKIPNPK